MSGPLPTSVRAKIVRYLLLHWRPDAIAKEVHCCVATVYNIQRNLFMFDDSHRPHYHAKDRPVAIHTAAQNSLMAFLQEEPCVQQTKLVWFL